MKQVCLVLKFMVFILPFIGVNGFAQVQKLPVIDGKATVALVNNEPITLESLKRAVAESNTEIPEKEGVDRMDYSAVVKRLVNTRLIVLEAKNIGLDKLPEVEKALDGFAKQTLMEMLIDQQLKDIKADRGEVEKIYRELVREWKIKAVWVEKEADIKRIDAEIKAGKNFDDLVKEAIKSGTGKGNEEGEYLRDKDLKPSIALLVSNMEVGSISPIISAGKKSFGIFRLEGVRVPKQEDPEARETAEEKALQIKKVQALKEYYGELKKKYVQVDEAVLDTLDYESQSPRFENLLNDDRLLVKIDGEDPITVGDLSHSLKFKFYHGIERAVEDKRINSRVEQTLEEMIEKRLLLREALKQGLDQSAFYKYRISEHEDSVLFGAFINKAIYPDIKLTPEEIETYYRENRGDYTFPQMMKIKSLVFNRRDDAVVAIEKITKGTDFNWLSAHAEGLADQDSKGILNFDGRLLSLNTLPEAVQKVVSTAGVGEARLYESPENFFYVLYIYDIIPPRIQSYESVKEKIANKIFNEKVKEQIDVWASKLGEYYPVKIYGTGIEK